MSARGTLRQQASRLAASAPPALVQEALGHALAGHGAYDITDPARLLACLIESAFGTAGKPTEEQINKVRAAVGAAIPLSRPLPKQFDVCRFYSPTSVDDRSCFTCGGDAQDHAASAERQTLSEF